MARKVVIKPINQDQLKKAVILLLDHKFGQTRTDRIRAILNGEVKVRNHPFRDATEPLNTILDFARTVSFKAANIMLDAADQHRERLAKLAVPFKDTPEAREKRRNYLNGLRARKTMALKIEEYRRGRKMSASEREKFLEDTMRRWNIRREKYIAEHIDLNRLEATSEFTKELEAELKAKLERAKAAGPVKAQSQTSKKQEPRKDLEGWKRTLGELRRK